MLGLPEELQPLSLLLEEQPIGEPPDLYDIAHAGVAADLSHIETRAIRKGTRWARLPHGPFISSPQ